MLLLACGHDLLSTVNFVDRVIVPRMTAGKRSELEPFWRAHLACWRRSALNQREYCELHRLPLKRFGNWRAKYKHEDDVPRQKLLWRRGGGLRHMSEHMLKEIPSAPSRYIPSVRSGGSGGRRNRCEADKRRIALGVTGMLKNRSPDGHRRTSAACELSTLPARCCHRSSAARTPTIRSSSAILISCAESRGIGTKSG